MTDEVMYLQSTYGYRAGSEQGGDQYIQVPTAVMGHDLDPGCATSTFFPHLEVSLPRRWAAKRKDE